MNAIHRRSIRLQGYDYRATGGYFITVVAFQRRCSFGEVIDGEMCLSPLGGIVRECWQEIPAHFSHAGLDAFVVMPNHVHGIIFIFDDDLSSTSRGTIYRAPIYRAPTQKVEGFGRPAVGSLPTIVRTFKAAVTRRARRELNLSNIWQRNYYEHILRDEKDHQKIAGYILANPSRWNDDEENPLGMKK